MEIAPFKVEHLEQIVAQEAQRNLGQWMNAEQARSLEGPYAFSGIEEGEVLICAGLAPIWGNRAMAWAYVGKNAGKRMVAITKAVLRCLKACPFDRIEATVDYEFTAGHRWVWTLGFNVETPRMRKHRIDGGDSIGYVRIR